MDPGLSIAASGLQASMTQIDVATENIANAQTPGYIAESAQLAEVPGGGTLGVGAGVQVTTVAQLTDAMLSANNLQAQGAVSSAGALQQVLTGIENVFPLGQSSTSSSATTSTSSSIAGQLSSFWSAWDAITQDPSALAPRTQVVDMAQGLVTSLSEASTQLTQLQQNTSSQIGTDVAQANTLLSQAASLNGSIIESSGGGASPNQLEDQLSNVVSQLASLAGVNVTMQQNGTAQVSIGGITVVQGSQADTLSTDPPQGYTPPAGQPTPWTTVFAYPSAAAASSQAADGVAAPVTGGALAGLLQGVNVSIPQYEQQLNGVANDLANTVNTQLAQGYDAAGTSGAANPLFEQGSSTAGYSTTSPPTYTASGISLNASVVADPTLIAAASGQTTASVSYANDGGNAQSMAELGTPSDVARLSTTVYGSSSALSSPDQAYQTLVEGIGSLVQNANAAVSSQTAVANQAQQALQAVSGVNQDTQLTDLMQYQANYQASAKVVSVIDSTIQSLLAAV